MSTQKLACPLIPPTSSTSGYDENDYEVDGDAMHQRCRTFHFPKSYEREDNEFPFDCPTFAEMVIYINENRKDFVTYVNPFAKKKPVAPVFEMCQGISEEQNLEAMVKSLKQALENSKSKMLAKDQLVSRLQG